MYHLSYYIPLNFGFQEELEDIRLDIEAEQKSLASEQARQNRIAASVSNEMFAECQVRIDSFMLVSTTMA